MAVASESYAPSVLVSTERLPEKDWLEYRRRGIGGSDAAAILGISPFATARDLYYDKLKIVPFDDSEINWVAKKMGHLLEDLVAEIFHVKTGYRIYQIKKMFYHPVHTFMLADIDYFVELPGGRTAILEIKTTNYNAKDHWWSEDGQEIVPLNYEAQGRHYIWSFRPSETRRNETMSTLKRKCGGCKAVSSQKWDEAARLSARGVKRLTVSAISLCVNPASVRTTCSVCRRSTRTSTSSTSLFRKAGASM